MAANCRGDGVALTLPTTPYLAPYMNPLFIELGRAVVAATIPLGETLNLEIVLYSLAVLLCVGIEQRIPIRQSS